MKGVATFIRYWLLVISVQILLSRRNGSEIDWVSHIRLLTQLQVILTCYNFIKSCETYWESKNWLFFDLFKWIIYHSYIFISFNLLNCCQMFKQAEIWSVQAEIINHFVSKINMFDSIELKWTIWRFIKLKNMILALTNALNKECASTRSYKIYIIKLRHVINVLKISRVSTYHLCSTYFFNFNISCRSWII